MKLRLLNASSELLFSEDVGNLPVTYGTDSTKKGFLFVCYLRLERVAFQSVIQIDVRQVGEPILKERKHIREFSLAYYFRKLGIA